MSERLLEAVKRWFGEHRDIESLASADEELSVAIASAAAEASRAWSPDPPTEEGWYWAWEPDYKQPIREYWTALALAAARLEPRPGRHWRPSPIPEPPAWPPASVTADEDTAEYVGR